MFFQTYITDNAGGTDNSRNLLICEILASRLFLICAETWFRRNEGFERILGRKTTKRKEDVRDAKETVLVLVRIGPKSARIFLGCGCVIPKGTFRSIGCITVECGSSSLFLHGDSTSITLSRAQPLGTGEA